MSYYNEMQQRIETIRKQKKISQKELCDHLDVTPQGWRGFFKNETIRVKTILDVADLLGVDPENILYNKRGRKKTPISSIDFETEYKLLKNKVAILEHIAHDQEMRLSNLENQ